MLSFVACGRGLSPTGPAALLTLYCTTRSRMTTELPCALMIANPSGMLCFAAAGVGRTRIVTVCRAPGASVLCQLWARTSSSVISSAVTNPTGQKRLFFLTSSLSVPSAVRRDSPVRACQDTPERGLLSVNGGHARLARGCGRRTAPCRIPPLPSSVS